MIINSNHEEFYLGFYEKLRNSQKWPGEFMFKFILDGQSKNLVNLKKIFNKYSPIFKLKKSKKKNFKV
ncbi:MAG: hypothetical protein P8M03_01965 [Flavobacteriaceae bacterium]|nr:hypothetical protein [Flavobacteriaceae bacterium]